MSIPFRPGALKVCVSELIVRSGPYKKFHLSLPGREAREKIYLRTQASETRTHHAMDTLPARVLRFAFCPAKPPLLRTTETRVSGDLMSGENRGASFSTVISYFLSYNRARLNIRTARERPQIERKNFLKKICIHSDKLL